MGDVPAVLVSKSTKFAIRAGYGPKPSDFKLQTQEKVPKQAGAKKMFGALIQQNLQLAVSDSKNLTLALFDQQSLLSSVTLDNYVGKLKTFTLVQLKDSKGKACGCVNLRIDHPAGPGSGARSGDDGSDETEEEEEEEEDEDEE